MRFRSLSRATLVSAMLALALASGAHAQDADADGVSDASDNCPSVSNASQNDCDGDGVGDACESFTTRTTGNMGAIGSGVTTSGTLVGVVASDWPVTLTARAVGDFSSTAEFASLRLAGTVVVSQLFAEGASDCPATPNVAVFVIPASQWNSLVAASPGGNMPVTIIGNAFVSATQCASPFSDVKVAITLSKDCNGNLVDDGCDLASGLDSDCDGNGRLDRCDVFFDGVSDDNGNCTPDSCERALGDFAPNGAVGGDDLGLLLSLWGTQSELADLSGNGVVGGDDLSILLSNWGVTEYAAGNCNALPWAGTITYLPDSTVVTSQALRDAIRATGLPWRVPDNTTEIELLLVPPGTYQMGCIQGSGLWACVDEELPVHTVTLTRPYYIGRYEVTQAQWVARMGTNPSAFRASNGYPNSESRPVEFVSWNMVQAFLKGSGLRLPTEAEWEFACRAGTATPFHSGPGFPNGTTNDALVGDIAWFDDNSNSRTQQVGLRAANALGLNDMLGNVAEWVNDFYSPYSAAAQVDPVGPSVGTPELARVERGGHFAYSSGGVRSSWRTWATQPVQLSFGGFRVARSPF